MRLAMTLGAGLLSVLATVATVPVAHVSAQTGAAALYLDTSFNCPEWVQNDGTDPCGPGDPVGPYGGWTTSTGQVDRITTVANNPLGSGRGFRHYRGAGVNNNAGGIKVDFPAATQVWLRLYMRYSPGFAWQNGQPHYTKDVYWNPGASNFRILGFSSGSYYLHVGAGSQNLYSSDTWAAINGGSLGDGQFHCYEQYMKIDTNGSNGEVKLWRDGNLVLSRTGLNLGGGTVNYFALGSNQSDVIGDHYTDYDDVAVSFTGYIGPLGSSGSQTPTAPTRLRITS
jgi:hypothetical protein